MLVIIGLAVIGGSIILGYVAHDGQLMILFQWTEMIIIFGSAIGSLIVANPKHVITGVFSGVKEVVLGKHQGKQAYLELLSLLFELFQITQREGVIALEPHIERPEQSSLFARYKNVTSNKIALEFLCDTLKVVLNGGVQPHEIEELMDADIETILHHESQPSHAVATVADAMPGLGIVAAVLGVVITMGKIDQPPAIIGHSVAAALVGTFLGVLSSYGLFGPVAKAMEHTTLDKIHYLQVIKAGLLAYLRNSPPSISVEYARRAIPLELRPTFQETEQTVKKR